MRGDTSEGLLGIHFFENCSVAKASSVVARPSTKASLGKVPVSNLANDSGKCIEQNVESLQRRDTRMLRVIKPEAGEYRKSSDLRRQSLRPNASTFFEFRQTFCALGLAKFSIGLPKKYSKISPNNFLKKIFNA
jgi:hypothetical protein